MSGIQLNKWHWMLIGLVMANIAYYIYNNWGLVTVKVTDEPLGKVISSIEWQGWVKIYTNLPLDSKVTMYADHVPVSEAMETLAANVDVPPPPDDGSNPNPNRPRRADGQGGPGNGPGDSGAVAAGPPPGGAPGAGGPNPGDPGTQGGRQGGRGGGFGGGGGFGRRAEWNLAFFVAPTSSQVKEEIREFQAGDPDTDAKVYTYGTQMQLIATDSMSIMADPRLQSWPGVKPPDPAADPPAQANTTSPAQTTDPADPPAPPPTALQLSLQAFTQSANIWIMAPGSWNPAIPNSPPPNSSIIRAMENFVSNIHGAMTEAIILRAGRGGPNGNPPGQDISWEDRMRNAINGLPADERPDAIDQLNQEVQFRKSVQALPPDQRRKQMMQHFAEKMIYGERLARLSPAKRAQVYHRMIMMRQAAKGQK